MTSPSPLLDLHHAQHAMLLGYGPEGSGVPVVQTYGQVEFEYASLRKGCLLFDHAQRGTLEIRGSDRLTFLNNMLTQNVSSLTPMTTRSCFWLNRKGRITADLRLCELEDRLVVDVDIHAAEPTAASLNEFVITEDVEIEVVTHRVHRLSLHGPTAADLLTLASNLVTPLDLAEGRAQHLTIAGHQLLAERTDWLGEQGYELSLSPDAVPAVWTTLRELGELPDLNTETGQRDTPPTDTQSSIRMRTGGWLAVNMARIEAGSAMFNLDFASTNLPAETSLLKQRIDFKKGCYLGQEVVARMDALGKPKQSLVGLILEGERVTASHPEPKQPITGAQVLNPEAPDAPPIGAVTSSTLSPMLGTLPVCFAMMKTQFTDPGTKVLVFAEGSKVAATVQPQLQFWSRPSD